MLSFLGSFVLLGLLAPAQAVEVPAFVPGQRVYLVPGEYAFPTRATREAVGQTVHPVYVVVYEEVIDGRVEPGHASETEDAIEQVWDTWRTAAGMATERPIDGFDGREGSLVLLAMDDREVRVMAGSRWDSELGLHNEVLGRLVDESFLPLARAGDYDGGLAALVDGLDERIEGELTTAAALAAEERRVATDRAVAEKRRELRVQAFLALLPTGVGVMLALAAILAVVLLRRRAVLARRSFEAAAAALQTHLDAADTAFADFRVDVELRDRLVDLRLKGPTTTALYQQVAGDLDAIQAGLAGLRRHLAERRAGVRAGFFAVQPWDEAIVGLQTRLTVEPARTEGRLFPTADAAIEVDPQAFMKGLEARFGAAHEGWKRLLDAVEASLHRAEQDLPRARYDAAVTALTDSGLPQAWLEGHPLWPEPAAALAELDETRRADPVAYLDALQTALAEEEASFAVLREVAEGLGAGRAARAGAEEPRLEGLDTVLWAEDGDPAAAQADADRALAVAEERAQARPEADIEALREALAATVAACEAWVGLKKKVLDAVREAPARVGQADEAVRRLEEQYAAGRMRAKSLAGVHDDASLAQVWREVGEASEDLEQARQAALQARARLGERRHLAALTLAERALLERGEAVQDLAELTAVMEALEQARTEAEALQRSLEARRTALVQELSGYGAYSDAARLMPGDELRARLVADWSAGAPADWRTRRERLQGVLRAWSAGIADARRAWSEEQARVAREIEEARRQQTGGSLGFLVTGSSSHGYHSISSGSSHRSGGHSFGSSHRSGGRSFGGHRGRSGGRKF